MGVSPIDKGKESITRTARILHNPINEAADQMGQDGREGGTKEAAEGGCQHIRTINQPISITHKPSQSGCENAF